VNAEDYRILRRIYKRVRFVLADSFVAVDIETTGLDDDAGLVEIAAVKFTEGEETSYFAMRVNPGRPIPPAATKIHGITDEDVAGAPPPADVLRELRNFGRTYRYLAFNAAFDALHIRRIGRENGLSFPPISAWIDPMKYIAYAEGRRSGRISLADACKRYGVELDPEKAHSAEADARAAGQVWIAATTEERQALSRLIVDGYEAARVANEERDQAKLI
jgi:DNA polymerase III subunit epsilon